jgi:hypothetical protein
MLRPGARLVGMRLAVSLQGGQCPIVLFAKSSKDDRQGEPGNIAKGEGKVQPAVDKCSRVEWLKGIANCGVHIRVQEGLAYLYGMAEGDVPGPIEFGH